MIAYLKGKILLKGKDFLIIRPNGVGYKVFVSGRTFEKAEELLEIELFIFTYLKRETIDLYGCSTQGEFELFEFFEKMPGIGPKTAIQLAGFGSVEELKKTIENKKTSPYLKGIGKKRLQRLLLELTGKIREINKEEMPEEKKEALTALIGLGFSKNNAQKALSKISLETKDPQKMVESALKILGNIKN